LCVFFTATAILSRRFLGFCTLAAAPFLMRDLEELVAGIRGPASRALVWGRAGAVAILCVAVAFGELWRPSPAVGVGMDERFYPIRAAEFIAEHGIRGHMYNQYYVASYLLYRFWPDRGRLPFLDIHQAGGPAIRYLYMLAGVSAQGWRQADNQFHFDYVVSDRIRLPDHPLLDVLDADSTWALVFIDDAAAVYVRRAGPLRPVAERFAYRHVPAGRKRVGPLGAECARDSSLRAEVAAELERAAASSPWNAGALSLLANIALVEGRLDEGRALIERALKVDPAIGRAHERLGAIAMETGRPRDAEREFEIEQAVDPHRPGISLRLGQAWRRLGDDGRAREWYRRELAIAPGNEEARDSLSALERTSPR
jgi:tetratricopeptide (TPR) repeat protein